MFCCELGELIPNLQISQNLKRIVLASIILVTLAISGPVRAQVVTYSNGEDDATDYTLAVDTVFETVPGGSVIAIQSGIIDLSTFTGTFDAMDVTDMLTISGVVSGTGDVIIDGPGTVVLSGANTYTGGTTINGGTLVLNSDTAAGTGLIDFTNVAAGTLDLNGVSIANDILISGGIPDPTILVDGGQTSTISGTVDFGLNSTGDLTINVAASSNLIVLGDIFGMGTLTKDGPGTLFLSGTNTFDDTLVIIDGTVQLDSSTAASTDSIIFGGSGDEVLVINNGLTVANDFLILSPGNITTLAGSTQVSTLSGTVALVASTLSLNTFDATDNLILSGVISGSGDITLVGSGTVVLSGANTFTGGTTVNGGRLQLEVVDALGTGTLTLAGGTLVLNNVITLSNDIDLTANSTIEILVNLSTPAGDISLGANFLTINGDMTSTGDISGTGGLIISNGIVRLAGSNTFSGGITVLEDSTLRPFGASPGTSIGTGVVTFNGVDARFSVPGNTLTTILNDLVFLQSGTISSQSGILNFPAFVDLDGSISLNNGALLTLKNFDSGDELTVNGVISGDGDIEKIGSGLVDLTSPNTFSGMTTVLVGTLRLSNANTLPDTGVVVVNGGTLELSGSDETIGNFSGTGGMVQLNANTLIVNQTAATTAGGTFTGVIDGSGGLTKQGTGVLDLTATNTYTGDTNVLAGTLLVNGSITSDTFVFGGARLGGTGSIFGNVDVMGLGTFAPGNSIGTINVTGTVTFGASSVFEAEIESGGTGDLLNITGTATIDSTATVNIITTPGFYNGDWTVITTTGGITGTFGGFTINDPMLAPVLVQDGSTVIIRFATPDPEEDGPTGIGALPSPVLGGLDIRTSNLAGHLNDTRVCRRAQGEFELYRNSCDPRQHASRSARLAQVGNAGPAQTTEWGKGTLWLQGYGGKAKMDTGGGRFNNAGFDLGYDRWVSDNVLLGASIGYSRNKSSAIGTITNAQSKYINTSLYASIDLGGAYSNSIFSYSFGDQTTARMINLMNVNQVGIASANFDSKALSFYSELGFDIETGNALVQPFAAINYSHLSNDAYTETGSLGGLTVQKSTLKSWQSTLGLRISTLWGKGSGAAVKPEFRALWVHEFGQAANPRINTVSFPGTTIPAFIITDPAGYKNAFIVGVGLVIFTGGNFNINLNYDLLISNEYDLHSGSARMVWVF